VASASDERLSKDCMARDRPRVFVDTNVIFSALRNPDGIPSELLRLGISGRFRWVTSPAALEETIRNVSNKLPGLEDRLALLLAGAELEVVRNASTDLHASLSTSLGRQDAALVGAAIESDVDFFVTGDKRLMASCSALGLSRPRFIPPRELRDKLKSTSE
jgi:putative PIN family toxin of toxin-antitoxin system